MRKVESGGHVIRKTRHPYSLLLEMDPMAFVSLMCLPVVQCMVD